MVTIANFASLQNEREFLADFKVVYEKMMERGIGVLTCVTCD